MEYVLEHLILEVLYKNSHLVATRIGQVPFYAKIHLNTVFHFGVVVDMINNPKKYKKTTAFDTNYKNLILKEEEISDKKFSFQEVADALDLLALNGDIIDDHPQQLFVDNFARMISITHKGKVTYKKKHYVKDAAEELFVKRSYEIQKTEHWFKKYWLFVAIITFFFGLLASAINKVIETIIDK